MAAFLWSGSYCFTLVHKVIRLEAMDSFEDESDSPLGQEKRMYIIALELIPFPVNILFPRNSLWSPIFILKYFLS